MIKKFPQHYFEAKSSFCTPVTICLKEIVSVIYAAVATIASCERTHVYMYIIICYMRYSCSDLNWFGSSLYSLVAMETSGMGETHSSQHDLANSLYPCNNFHHSCANDC